LPVHNDGRPGDEAGEQDRDFHRAVRAATAVAYARAAWQPPEYAYVILATQLRNRGIHPDPDAVYAGAELISKGIPPPVIRTDPRRAT
jgi:hypothetical protein